MNLNESLQEIGQKKKLIATCYLDQLSDEFELFREQLTKFCREHHRIAFDPNDCIVFVVTWDHYEEQQDLGVRLQCLQRVLNEVDISNFFVTVVTTNPEYAKELAALKAISTDEVSLNFVWVSGDYNRLPVLSNRYQTYRYGSPVPIKINLSDLSDRQKFLLIDSKVFCMYPWIHLHPIPTGEVYPCCHSSMHLPVGNSKTDTLETIWRDDPMQRLRNDMMNERTNPACNRCYEQETAGFFSGRQSANKHHGHQIKKIDDNPFEMTYWDIRFSNLCNLRCRSCGSIYSSSWYQDQAKLAGPDWAKKNKAINFVGRTEIDMWEQLLPHFEYVEQVYFAGGEPLMMEEHYRILDELERRERFDVRLIYNTNFTQTRLKDRSVFDYWKKFSSVAVGASLDAMGARAEYIRKGTDWAAVEANRREMLEICPRVDFYISPTLSIMNAWHLPDFHRAWVEAGLIRAQDLNVNILQDPAYYRIDIAPMRYKQRLRMRFEEHLEWLRPQDTLQRATVGVESAITFMMSTDNTALIERFRTRTRELDAIRKENVLDVLPELEILYDDRSPF